MPPGERLLVAVDWVLNEAGLALNGLDASAVSVKSELLVQRTRANVERSHGGFLLTKCVDKNEALLYSIT